MCEPLRGVREIYTGEHGVPCGKEIFDRFKSAVEFYKKYRHFEFNLDELKDIIPEDVKIQYEHGNSEYVDDWLFDYCFGDVI